MSLDARSILSTRRSCSGARSSTAMAVIVERNSGSFSMPHIRASASLIRRSKRMSSAMAPSRAVGQSLSAHGDGRRHEWLLSGPAVPLAHVAHLAGQEDDGLLPVDLGEGDGGGGVVGVGDDLDVEAMGGDVTLEEVVGRLGRRRVAVGGLPADAWLARAVDGGIGAPALEVRPGIGAGAVVEAAVVAVVGNGDEPVGGATGDLL